MRYIFKKDLGRFVNYMHWILRWMTLEAEMKIGGGRGEVLGVEGQRSGLEDG